MNQPSPTQPSPIQPGPTKPGLIREFITIIAHVAVPQNEPPAVVWRRRIVVAIVLVAGAVLLGRALRTEPGEPEFYWLSLGLAALWAGGALASGPLRLGIVQFRGRYERPVFTGTGVGLVLGGVFVLAAWVARTIPVVDDPLRELMGFADQGSVRLLVAIVVLSAVAEEMFFRGALYTALVRHYPLTVSTLLYTAVALASGNWLLALTALVLGTVCGIERRATNGVLAPVLTHVVWGFIMVLALPPLFA
ncbi:MAG TPA: CPBP family intramembrane glutamic endopeptidase [Mycobacterium sp.]|nr:CPBP family intramembrane glutamic endopeptidase [Mycobacterium sp.]